VIPSYSGSPLYSFKGNFVRLENLKPDTTYVVKVKARNAVGLGPAFITSLSTTSLGELLLLLLLLLVSTGLHLV